MGPKGGLKHKTAYYEAISDFKAPKIHSWVVKLDCCLKESARSIFFTTARLWGPTRAKKSRKWAPQGGLKHKIAYYEAKWDFKVPKFLSCVVKLVCYLK